MGPPPPTTPVSPLPPCQNVGLGGIIPSVKRKKFLGKIDPPSIIDPLYMKKNFWEKFSIYIKQKTMSNEMREHIERVKYVMNLYEVKNMGLLYHYTSMRYAEKIMESNKLIGTLNYWENRKYKIVSLTRDRNLHKTKYFEMVNNTYFVRFVLDSEKLSQNYKIRPIFSDVEKMRGKQKLFGAEEGVIADEIYPLTEYLVRIEIIKPLMDMSLEKYKDKLSVFNLDNVDEFIKKYDVRLIDLNNKEVNKTT